MLCYRATPFRMIVEKIAKKACYPEPKCINTDVNSRYLIYKVFEFCRVLNSTAKYAIILALRRSNR